MQPGDKREGGGESPRTAAHVLSRESNLHTHLAPCQIAVEIMLHTDSRDASRFFAVDGRAPHFEVRRPPDFSPLVGVAAAARPCPHAPRLSASRLRTASSDSPDFDGRSFGWPAGEPDGGGGFTGPLPRRSCWPLNEM